MRIVLTQQDILTCPNLSALPQPFLSLLVYNVSASPQHEKKTFLLQHLSPSQEYTVWVRAVTAAGPGAKTTQRFKTKEQEGFGSALHLNLSKCEEFMMRLSV